jgi:hypothetical protein
MFNQNLRMVQEHLRNLEKYLLLNTQLFPREWKSIALSLQSQRVPDEWEHPNCRPSIHTLKSWIKSQTSIHAELRDVIKSKFASVKSLSASTLRNPDSLIASVLIQKCIKNKWDIDEAEICFELKEDNKLNAEPDSVLMKDIKIIGGAWSASKKSLISSEYAFNIFQIFDLVQFIQVMCFFFTQKSDQ